MQNTFNNNAFQAELLVSTSKPKPITAFVTTSQLLATFPFLAERVDETFLRNRASVREINPRTGAPWIPKPRNNQFPLSPTLLGLLEWFITHADRADGIPEYFDSMQALEDSPLGIPKEFSMWAVRNGAGEARLGGSRINPRPILKKANDILRRIPTGQVTGIDGLEEWDKDTELAKKLRLESDALADQQLRRRGELLMSRDATFAINELVADELIWEKRDQPLRAALLAAPRTINRQHKTILAGDEPTPAKIRKCAAIVTDTISAVLARLRAKIPRRIVQPELDQSRG